ncbi:MAG: hypothetical protein KGQ57_18085 [Burkholderiales bacterium]|nr:hypothetical protein [Burkholderiales bacterium]
MLVMTDRSTEPTRPYLDNAVFLDDLRGFFNSLLAQSRYAFPEPIDRSFSGALSYWGIIAARMATTVKSEIFIPLAHVVLVFRLDARHVRLLALALMVETDRSISAAFAALSHSLEVADATQHVAIAAQGERIRCPFERPRPSHRGRGIERAAAGRAIVSGPRARIHPRIAQASLENARRLSRPAH